MASQIAGNAGEKGPHFSIGEDNLSFKAWGEGGDPGWGVGGEVILEECEDDPLTEANWHTVPSSEIDCDGGYNLSTGIKFMRVAISLGTGLTINYVLKKYSTTGEVTK